MQPMIHQLETDFAIGYAVRETDRCESGGLHFANYLRIAEEVEYAYLRSRGVMPVQVEARGTLGFPRVNVRLDVRIDAWSGSDLQVRLTTIGHDGKRLVYRFAFSAADRTLAQLEFTVACCRFPPRGDPFAIPLPDSLLRALFPEI